MSQFRIERPNKRPGADAGWPASVSLVAYAARVLSQALARLGLGQMQNEDQLVVSSQEGPVWPNRGNSFWLSHNEGLWYLSTWLPVCYRVPAGQDIVSLCSACMSASSSAMYRVPTDIVARYQLHEIDDREYERLFPKAESD